MGIRVLLIRFCWFAAILLSMLAQGKTQDVPPIRALPMADAKVIGRPEFAQGNIWLHWSGDHQLGFVQGWAEGGQWEYRLACTEAQIAAPSVRNVQDKCMEHFPATNMASEEYSARVTEFYSKYPQDRALPIRRVLKKFLESGMTADKIHKWLDDLIASVQRSFAK